MRRKEKNLGGFVKTALELHYYRPAFYDFLTERFRNEHVLHEANIDKNSIVLDVGAYIGEWSQEVSNLYQPTIYAFEPVPGIYKKLLERTATLPRLKTLSYGLGERNEEVKISLKGQGSSVFNMHTTKSDATWVKIKICDIFQVWSELKLEKVDLLKINIEGGEYGLLERMIEKDLIGKVDCFLIQFHEWLPRAYWRRYRIRRALKRTHRLVWDYPFVWEKWERKTA